MIVFPTDLPLLESVGSIRLQRGDPRLRPENDRGPAKVRRVSTSVPHVWDLGHEKYTTAELNDLIDFYDTTLSGGVDSFEMETPLGTTETVRFVSTIAAEPAALDCWAVAVQVEQLA